jgi:hypothetical protein
MVTRENNFTILSSICYCLIYDVVEKLALRLCVDEATDKHLKIFDQARERFKDPMESDELKDSIEALRQKMKDMMQVVVDEDVRFSSAVKKYYGDDMLKSKWGLIQDWLTMLLLGRRRGDIRYGILIERNRRC